MSRTQRKANPLIAAYRRDGYRPPNAIDFAAERKKAREAKQADALAKAAEMAPEEVLALQDKLAKAQKTVRSLTGAQADMEKAADIIASINVTSAWNAVGTVRRAVFGDAYAGVATTRVEGAIAAAKPSAFKMVVTYEVLKGLIQKELEEGKAKALEAAAVTG